MKNVPTFGGLVECGSETYPVHCVNIVIFLMFSIRTGCERAEDEDGNFSGKTREFTLP